MMNLLKDKWLPVIRLDGSGEKIAPWEITAGYKINPVKDISAPRADFRNALYQLLIGLIQVSCPPADEEEWADLWEKPPGKEELQKAMLVYADCFNLDSQGPAFMQDFAMPETDPSGITALLIEAPGAKTLRENKDFFIKRKEDAGLSPYWAAVALFTLQINAPAGGSGYRTGVRGGGPLTTLLLPEDREGKETLWRKLWCNILYSEEVEALVPAAMPMQKQHIFPWMRKTKDSTRKEEVFFPGEAHALHVYFAMPRRIRLIFSGEEGICAVSGERTDNLVKEFYTVNHGNNYSPHWKHPLTPYFKVKQKKGQEANTEPDVPCKGQPGGILYRHWAGYVLGGEGNLPALVVQRAAEGDEKQEMLDKAGCVLWVAGYDMASNMKVRCWYEATMPVFFVPAEERAWLASIVAGFVEAAAGVALNTKKQVKEAWFKSSRNVKGDPDFITSAFWQETEADFYLRLRELVSGAGKGEGKEEVITAWQKRLSQESRQLFDRWVLGGEPDGLDLMQVFEAEKWLRINNANHFKKLRNLGNEA